MGGDAGLQISASHATDQHAKRGVLQRLAGSSKRVEYGWRDRERLYLPDQIAHFPERERNRQLYLWLVALAAAGGTPPGDWIQRSACQTRTLLHRFPGLQDRYHQLVESHLAQRPALDSLPQVDRPLEQMIRAVLLDPSTTPDPIASNHSAPQPVLLT